MIFAEIADRFWTWFEKYADLYLQLEPVHLEALLDALHRELRQVHPQLTFEFSPLSEEGQRLLIISADGIAEAFPAAVRLVEWAPELARWEFMAFRPRIPDLDQAVELEGVSLHPRDVSFDFEVKAGELTLSLFIQAYDPDNNLQGLASLILLDAMLGEYDTVTKISSLRIHALSEASEDQNLLPFDLLPLLVQDLKAGRLEGSVPVTPPRGLPSDDANPYEVGQTFALLRSMQENLPRLDVINTEFYHFDRKAEFPWLLRLEIPFASLDELGIEEAHHVATLGEIEELLEQLIEDYGGGYYVNRTTWNDLRWAYYHVAEIDEVEDLMSILADQEDFPKFNYRIRYERDWESMRSLLGRARGSQTSQP